MADPGAGGDQDEARDRLEELTNEHHTRRLMLQHVAEDPNGVFVPHLREQLGLGDPGGSGAGK